MSNWGGLKTFLRKDYENLITLDLVCHSVPSPLIFREYLQKIQERYQQKITNLSFRYKKPSWTVFSMKIDFEDGSSVVEICQQNEYIRLFLDDYITREACHNCHYASTARISDFTIADFWGYQSDKYKYRNDEKGISMVMANTDEAEKLLAELEGIRILEKSLEEAKKGNQCLRKPFPSNDKEEAFWEDYHKNGYDYVVENYVVPQSLSKKRKLSMLLSNHLYLFPAFIQKKFIHARDNIKRSIEQNNESK